MERGQEQVHEVAASLPHAILSYVAVAVGEAEAERILAASGEQRTLRQLEERGAWTTTAVTLAIAEAAAKVTRDRSIGRRGGDILFRSHVERGIGEIFAAEGSVTDSLEFVIDASSRVTVGRLMTVVERTCRAVVVEERHSDGPQAHRLFSDFAAGYWANVPTLFGADGYAAKVACTHDGDPRCLTRVTWSAPVSPEESAGGAKQRRNQMFERFEELQAMAAELAAADDVATVLDLIVDRAGTAVLAPQFLLVGSLVDGGNLRVHHRGFADHDAARLAADHILAGDPSSSTLVVDVSSARRHFGRIAAFYPPGTTERDVDRRLMTAYAGHAAAALEAAAAMEQAQRDRDTATSLLGLARELALVGTPGEVAHRLAATLPAIVGADAASVWLWDPSAEVLRRAAGNPARFADALPRHLAPGDVRGLAELIAEPRPVLVTADRIAGLLDGALAVEHFTQVAAIPLVARNTLLGLVGAGFRSTTHDGETDALLDRLSGFADQAARAVDNAQLVERIRHQALHDALTGLPNRVLVEDRANQALATAKRTGQHVGLLFVDLDRFKNVNDTLGHRIGDEVICQVVARLGDAVDHGHTLGRLGGDEFVVLVTGIDDAAAVIAVADRMVDALRSPFDVVGQQIFISCSIGIALAPTHANDYEALMQHADAAMYEAKARGRNTFAVHSPDPAGDRHDLLELESALHLAIERDELAVVYQPQVDLKTLEVVGVEALVRWHHPVRGTIGPDTFVPLAEDSGLIVDIDRWVRRTALGQAREWLDDGLPALRMSFNLSTRELRDPAVADGLAADLARFALTPGLVEIEVTERVVMAEEDLPAILDGLRSTGVRLAIDDFGTGSSVLSRLQRCPIDTLKIDKSFVQEITSSSAGAIVAALVQMADTLQLEVVAEGVENELQASVLRDLGCHMAQGFLYSRPVSATAIAALLAGGTRRPRLFGAARSGNRGSFPRLRQTAPLTPHR